MSAYRRFTLTVTLTVSAQDRDQAAAETMSELERLTRSGSQVVDYFVEGFVE